VPAPIDVHLGLLNGWDALSGFKGDADALLNPRHPAVLLEAAPDPSPLPSVATIRQTRSIWSGSSTVSYLSLTA
jgi:hypothetical protein